MAILMIGYDLNPDAPDTDLRREHVIEAIKSLSDTYFHSLDTTWLVQTDIEPREVAAFLWRQMHKTDELLVAPLDLRTAVWAGFGEKYDAWLQDHF